MRGGAQKVSSCLRGVGDKKKFTHTKRGDKSVPLFLLFFTNAHIRNI